MVLKLSKVVSSKLVFKCFGMLFVFVGIIQSLNVGNNWILNLKLIFFLIGKLKLNRMESNQKKILIHYYSISVTWINDADSPAFNISLPKIPGSTQIISWY
ncbi:MAG: hypothetical protein ACI90V_006970 [Bacillariaceae sp.]|jgi:hypothetical protein